MPRLLSFLLPVGVFGLSAPLRYFRCVVCLDENCLRPSSSKSQQLGDPVVIQRGEEGLGENRTKRRTTFCHLCHKAPSNTVSRTNCPEITESA